MSDLLTPPDTLCLTSAIDQSKLSLSFCFKRDKPMVTIRPDGQIEYGECYTPDEVAHAFWTAVNHHGPFAENNRLRAENEKLRAERDTIGEANYVSGWNDAINSSEAMQDLRAENEKLQKSLQDMTIRYSESIDEKVGLRGDNEKLATKQFVLDAVILSLHEDIEDLRAAMHDIYEVYAGSEGFHPQTCLEVYLQKHIKEMADIAAIHKRAAAAALKETGDE